MQLQTGAQVYGKINFDLQPLVSPKIHINFILITAYFLFVHASFLTTSILVYNICTQIMGYLFIIIQSFLFASGSEDVNTQHYTIIGMRVSFIHVSLFEYWKLEVNCVIGKPCETKCRWMNEQSES